MDDKITKALMSAWEGRPWKDHATNPPSMLPQLGLALGLLHPRLGGATRDMGIAREMARRPVDVPAQVPGDAAMHARIGMAERDIGNMRRFTQYGGDDVRLNAGNSNAPAVMAPGQGPIMPPPGNANPAPAASAPRGAMAQYEQLLMQLERSGAPQSQFPSFRDFLSTLQ